MLWKHNMYIHVHVQLKDSNPRCGSFCLHSFNSDEEKSIPVVDRQRALSLLLELTLQRGTLQHILDAILLLLQLAEKASKSNDLLKTEDKKASSDIKEEDACCPLVPFLRRIGGVPTPKLPPKGANAVS